GRGPGSFPCPALMASRLCCVEARKTELRRPGVSFDTPLRVTVLACCFSKSQVGRRSECVRTKVGDRRGNSVARGGWSAVRLLRLSEGADADTRGAREPAVRSGLLTGPVARRRLGVAAWWQGGASRRRGTGGRHGRQCRRDVENEGVDQTLDGGRVSRRRTTALGLGLLECRAEL